MKNKAKIIRLLYIAAIIVLFLFTERTIRGNFLFSCTYRMQTISTYLPIICSWIIFAAFIVFAIRKKLRFSFGVLIPYCIIYLGYLAATLINHASMVRWTDAFVYSLPPFMLAIMAFSCTETAKIYIKSATWIFVFLAAMNLLFDVFPQMWGLISEWREEYFLGYHTLVSWPLTTGLMFAFLDREYNGRNWLLIIYLILFFANMAVVRAGGALVGAFIVALWLLLPFVRKAFKKWNMLVFIAIVVALFAVLMWGFQPFVNFPPVKAFIENVLHKDITLSGRLYVWSGVLERVYASPFIGYGFGDSTQIFFEPSKWNNTMVHAHNLFLQCWYEGGIITLLLGLGMLVFAAFKMEKCRNLRENCNESLCGVFKLLIFAALIMLQSDQDVYYNWYIPAFFCHLAIVSMESSNGETIKPQTD